MIDSSILYVDAARLQRAIATLRAICFYTTTFVFAAPLFVFMLAVYPLVLLFDKYRYVYDSCKGNNIYGTIDI